MVESGGGGDGLSDAEAALCEVVEVTAMVLDAATMYLDVELRSLCIATLVRCIRPCTATRCVELGMLFSSAKLLDAATDFVVDGLLLVALPRRAACMAAACIAGAQARAEAEGLTVDSVQQLPLDFAPLEACVPPNTGGPAEGEWSPHCGVNLRPEFRSWLDLASNHEMALHLVREIIERYTSQHFEDVLGAKAGPLRAQAGLTHAAELLGGVEEALSSTWAAGTSNGFGSGVEKGAGADEVAFSGVVAGVVEQLLARR